MSTIDLTCNCCGTDVTACPIEKIGRELRSYLIASDVFEHVTTPVSRAFAGARKVLTSGSVFVITVPFTNGATTTEHFPGLYSYQVVKLDDEYVLINKTGDGRLETFRNLTFHGGPGTALEMRLFCRSDIIRHLESAGFTALEIMDHDVVDCGIINKYPWSLPIVARAA